MADVRIKKGHKRYHLQRIIGHWGPDLAYHVYEAVQWPDRQTKPLLAFKMLPRLTGPQGNTGDWEKFQGEINNFSDILIMTQNVLVSDKKFKVVMNNVQHQCLSLPYEGVFPFRALLIGIPNYRNGMPLHLIEVILKETLKVLKDLHNFYICHSGISAGTVMYSKDPFMIKLSVSATLYEPNVPAGPPGFLPLNTITSWGVAPALENEESESDSDDDIDMFDVDNYLRTEKKNDIWLVGLLILELAYGTILVSSREELLQIIAYIQQHDDSLPATWTDLRNLALNLQAPGYVSYDRFPGSFVRFLKWCLNEDPWERPTVSDCLEDNFLKNSTATIEDLMLELINY